MNTDKIREHLISSVFICGKFPRFHRLFQYSKQTLSNSVIGKDLAANYAKTRIKEIK
jgi:hypothetical protein